MPNILICDDDVTTREMLGGVLKANGYAVTTVPDGPAALKTLAKKKFDLVLLDIWMPGMSGLELLARLQKEKQLPKIIIMTSDQTPETLLSALRGKVYQFITKPIESDVLLELVREALATEPECSAIEVLSAQGGAAGALRSLGSQQGAELPGAPRIGSANGIARERGFRVSRIAEQCRRVGWPPGSQS